MLTGHGKQWEFLQKKFEASQLSHAYLFSGVDDSGKKDFSKKFAEFVGCKFPDLMTIEPAGGQISIAKIREVQNFLAYKSYNGGFKIVIVNDAHSMNQEAQSCFLKTLEEPKGETLLILISSKPDMLLPTILSRCQTIKFLGKPILDQRKIDKENEILQGLLKVAGAEFSEKFKYAKSLDADPQKLGDILEVLQKYLRYLLFLKIGIGKLENQKYFSEISVSALNNYPVLKIEKIINLAEGINNKLIFTNANPKLALEILLMEI